MTCVTACAGINLYENLKVQELQIELTKRGVSVVGKKKPQLQTELEELRRGITNVPALLQNTPNVPLDSIYLHNYEILPTEPLHDIKGHLSNVTDELLAHTTGNVKKKLSSIYSSVLGKETLRCCDYREASILILLALEELKADRKVIELMRTLVEITEIMYSTDSKRSSQTVLRLHNTAFVHGKLCTELFHTPKTMTTRKMFGRYFHSLTTHAPILYRMVCLRSVNAEMQERIFGQCKAITKATSSQHPDHIIKNILLRLQEQSKDNISSLKAQESEITKLANALGSKCNTIIPKQWLHQIPHQYQAHLERTSDFLIHGPGCWWKEVCGDIEFFDSFTPPGCTLPPHQIFHYCSTKLTSIESHLLTKWEECIDNQIPLPATHVRTYTTAGSLHSIDTQEEPEDDNCQVDPSHIPTPKPTSSTQCESSSLSTIAQSLCSTCPSEAPSSQSDVEISEASTSHPTHSTSMHTCSTATNNNMLQSSQAETIAKVLPGENEVMEFDKLRTQVKALKEKCKPLPSKLCNQYDAVSSSLRNKLVEAYKANSHALNTWREEFKATRGSTPHKHDYPPTLRTTSQSKELARKILLHEWQQTME